MSTSESRSRPCPRCGQPASLGPNNPWRPFCSERCRLIDLGAWADERYRVPAEEDGERDDLPDDDTDGLPH